MLSKSKITKIHELPLLHEGLFITKRGQIGGQLVKSGEQVTKIRNL